MRNVREALVIWECLDDGANLFSGGNSRLTTANRTYLYDLAQPTQILTYL